MNKLNLDTSLPKCAAIIAALLSFSVYAAKKPAIKQIDAKQTEGNQSEGKQTPKHAFSMAKFQSTYRDNQSLEASFVQEVYQASLARTKTSKGTIQLSKPNLARWEISEPDASVMVSNGKKLWYFTPSAAGGKGQVIERKAAELVKQPVFKILTGAASIDKEFQVEIATPPTRSPEKWTQLLLKPKAKVGDLKRAVIDVSDKYLISEINLENASGNKTKITLQNQNLGAKLPPALFDFRPPAGSEMVREGE